MSDPGGPGALLRAIALLLLCGADGRLIRTELDDAFVRDLGRGMSRIRAGRRYLANAVGSWFSLLRSGVRLSDIRISRLDVKLGLRLLRRQPGLAVVAMLALAIGIPVGLAPMHTADAFQTPPPFETADRMQVLKYYNTATSLWETGSVYDFTVWREELTAFETLAVTTRGGAWNLGVEAGRATPVRGDRVTASTFDALRVPALMGRTLTAADEAAGAPPVVLVSHDLWQARLGGTADVIGRSVTIDGAPHEIVGVMPDGFQFPIGDQLWLPLRLDATVDDHAARAPLVFGVLAEGVPVEVAQAEFEAVNGRLAVGDPELHARLRPEVVPFTIGLFGLPKGGFDDMFEFQLVQMLALLVLTVACLNIGMLFLARTTARSGEMAIRTALGASRSRVVSQLFAESLVLAVLAAGVGLVAGDIVANRAFTWLVEAVPNWIDLGVTPRTLLHAMVLSIFSAGIVGVIPALKVTGRSVQRNIQKAAASRSGVRFGGLSSVLIVTDVALAVATLGLGLAATGELTKTRNGMGIDPARYLSALVALPAATPGPADDGPATLLARDAAAQQELIRRIREQPDVRSVAVADMLPGTDHRSRKIEIEGLPLTEDGEGYRVRFARVDIGYFDALEQPMLSGREFDRNDLLPGTNPVIVNTNFVERVLGGRNPIGQRIRYVPRPGEQAGPWHEIVGVVGHLGMFELNPDLDEGIYEPLPPGAIAAELRAVNATSARNPIRMAIRTDADPQAFGSRLREIALEVDAAALVGGVQRLDEVFSFDRYTMGWVRLGALALVAILLAMSTSGTYALMSFTVSRRTREIGIRTALGEGRRSLALAIARRSVVQVGIGVLIGLAMLGVLLPNLNSMLQRPALELIALATSVGLGVMLIVSVLACAAPTWRALRILPVEALRG